MQIPPICPYCHNPSTNATGKEIYPLRTDLHHLQFFECKMCDAYVGCHNNGTPLGRLANPELRAAKQKAHQAFDPLWKSGKMSRTGAYSWLSKILEIPPKDCHIGMFNIETCQKATKVCLEKQKNDHNL